MAGSNGKDGMSRTAAQVGLFACALLVFLGGYYAMRTDDWRKIAGFTAIALVGGILASLFARRAR